MLEVSFTIVTLLFLTSCYVIWNLNLKQEMLEDCVSNFMETVEKIKKTFRSSVDTSSNKYLMVPIFIFFALLIFALIRSPILISQSGIGSAIMLTAPLILTTYALTFIAMAGRGGVDLSIGPFMGFINVSSIQLLSLIHI